MKYLIIIMLVMSCSHKHQGKLFMGEDGAIYRADHRIGDCYILQPMTPTIDEAKEINDFKLGLNK